MIEYINTVQGYRPDEPDVNDRIFGAVPLPVILPSGNWRELRIQEEFQSKRNLETFGCVTFTNLNALEKLAKLLFLEEWNKSERFTYIASETNPADRGNSPRKVADSVRNKGVIDESELPFDALIRTLEEFNSPKPLTFSLLEIGRLWRLKYDLTYYFLPVENGVISRAVLKDALTRGCVGITVYAWAKEGDVYIRPQGGIDTHLTLLENVKDNGELEVFDSYSPADKTLSKDFAISYAICYNLRLKTKEEQLKSTQLSLIELLQKYVLILFRQIYKVGGEILSGVFSKRN